MIKKSAVAICFMACLFIALEGCGSSSLTSGNVIHMDDHTFTLTKILIKKGETVLFINDSLVSAHPLQNGKWKNGTPQPLTELGAPKIDTVVNGGGQTTLGPFSMAGTYHIYCTAHADMQITVIVQ